MSNDIIPRATHELAATRTKPVSDVHEVFSSLSVCAFPEGALPVKGMRLIVFAAVFDLRIDTPIEAAYIAASDILPHVFEPRLVQS
jgi:hypothetical protein